MTQARPLRSATLGVVFLTLFLDLVGFSIVFPLFADKLHFYMARDNGVLHWAMSLVEGFTREPQQQAALFGGLLAVLYSGLQFIAAPLWGRLSDRIGRRPVLLVSLTGSALSYLLWVVSADFLLFVISRVIAGAMSGNTAVANAAVSDITTPETRSRGMATVGMAFGLGFVIGPALGGLTAGWQVGETVAGSVGWHPFSGPALIAAGLAVANLVWAVVAFRETLPPQRRVAPGTVSDSARPLDPRAIIDRRLGAGVPVLNLVFMLFTLLFSGMEATLVFLAHAELGFAPMHLGFLFAGMGLLSAAVQGVVVRRHGERLGVRRLGLIGIVLLIPGFVCIGLVDWFQHLALLLTGVAFLACATGLVFPALSTLVSLAGDLQRQGLVMGTFRSASALGRAAGPLLGAMIYFWWRPGGTYLMCAMLALLPMLLLLRAPSMSRFR